MVSQKIIRETDIRNGSELVALLIDKIETPKEVEKKKKAEEAPTLTVTKDEDDSNTINIIRKEQTDSSDLQKSTS